MPARQDVLRDEQRRLDPHAAVPQEVEPGPVSLPHEPLVRDGSAPLVRPRRIDRVMVCSGAPDAAGAPPRAGASGPDGRVQAGDRHGVPVEPEVPERTPGALR